MEKNNTLDVATAKAGSATVARSSSSRSASASSKLKRAFSMPRNPFQGSRNGATKSNATASRVTPEQGATASAATAEDKTNGGAVAASGPAAESDGSEKKIFRRLSVKKFINRIAQQMTYVNRTVSNHKFDKVQTPQTIAAGNTGASAAATAGGGNFRWPADSVPGVIGLRNHGNTCFMNAVLQCLSHTDILAQYFVLDLYKADLKRRNKINAKKFGTKGELTEQLALVLKALWTCRDAPDYSSNFKAVVDRYGSQFRSSTQHDAQEFLFWLLDKVHEDLNTATKRKYKAIKNNGRSDEVIAAETLANYVRCNNSFVQAVFQAQFRSSLSCPTCGKQSNTFDPFYCLSVPLPQLSQQPVLVKVIYTSQQPKQVKLGIAIPHGSPVLALREQLHADTGIALDRMILAEIEDGGFNRVFSDEQPMSTIHESDPIYCIECPPGAAATGQNQDTAGGTKILLCLCNAKRTTDGTVKRFGTPFCLLVNRDISHGELQKLLLKEMSGILRSEVFAFATPAQSLFRLRLQDPSCDADAYLEPTVEHPLFTEMIDNALAILSTQAVGPAHVKLLLEWSEPEKFFSDQSDPFVEHESVNQLRERIPASSTLTLEQCFEHYTKAETLGQDNAWKCPHCQRYLPVVKTLGLWSLPDIMVIHLKRFRQQQLRATTQAAKLTNLVKFPLRGFDMTPHLARDLSHLSQQTTQQQQQHHQANGCYTAASSDTDNWSPWRKIKRHSSQIHSGGGQATHSLNRRGGEPPVVMDNRYDLYAVCYHQGDTLETGHYTAACKNPYDGQWYRFDDQRVTHVAEDRVDEEIINNEAYLLFYQRRKLPNGDGSECSASSSSSSGGDHWVSRIVVPPGSTAAGTASSLTGPVSSTLERNKAPVLPASSPASTSVQPEIKSPPIADKQTNGVASSPPSAAEATVDSKDSEPVEKEKPTEAGVNSHNKVANSSSSIPINGGEGEEATDGGTGKMALVTPFPSPPQLGTPCSSAPVDGTLDTTIIMNAKDKPSPADEKLEQSVDTKSTASSPIAAEAPPAPPQSQLELTFRKAKTAEEDVVSSKVHFSLRQQNNTDHKLDTRKVDQKLISANGGRFSLPSSQQYQDMLWRENMSELMHHRPSSFATYKSVIDTGDAVSLIRGANTCSKDTLLYIDQQGHGLVDRVVLDDDDDPDDLLPGGGSSRALWISPVTPHKLITVSPKN
ncbi:ubiquitin carboxyl-terminal hydrolase 31-like isoform X1 [Anopheles albimanus]|uniref:ubiquitin carboxyl-terminal hydrolase 31-like isoform X1 n=1 Tax=Anopheles albimanus TaxID=7167 RepID=UPI001640E8CC|nr:ubiquitin carboxyl-terminal hydrolase 31-like isoform X1 [Anopheles albimanus]